jgi:hypothetical protein
MNTPKQPVMVPPALLIKVSRLKTYIVDVVYGIRWGAIGGGGGGIGVNGRRGGVQTQSVAAGGGKDGCQRTGNLQTAASAGEGWGGGRLLLLLLPLVSGWRGALYVR